MTGMLFPRPKKRVAYRPKGYRSKFSLDNDTPEPEEIGPVAEEFEGDLSNDPLEDAGEDFWATSPGMDDEGDNFWGTSPGLSDEYFEDEDFGMEDEYDRGEPLTNTSSRRSYKGFPYDDLHNQPFIPGHKWPTYLYRGLAIKMPSDVEGELDFAMMEGDQQGVFQVGRKILDIIGRSGIGRHWTTEPDVAMDFARRSAPNGNLAIVLSVVWERDGEDLATEHEGYDGVVRPSRLVGEEEVTLERGTRIKVISMKGSRVLNGSLMERNFDIEFLSSPEMRTASQLVANDNILDSLNPTGTVFTDYTPEDRASRELAPNIRPYSEINDVDPDERMVVYRGVPKGVQSELADGDFITDMEQLAKDYAGYPYGDVISQEVFADEILDDLEGPMSGEYLFRPRRASKKTPERLRSQKSSSRREAVDSEPPSPQTLYRGVRMNLDPEDESRIRQTIEQGVLGQSLEDIGKELTVGPELLDRMEEYGGIGTHWSTRPEIAERFSLQSGGDGGGTPVMLTTEWDGSGQDHDRTGVGGDWLDESEITLLPGTPLSVNSVTFGSSFGDGYEVLNTDKYDRYTESFTSQGLQPPKGGPQSRFARNEFSSRREAKGQNLYRGLSSDFLTEDEYSQISDWAMKNEFDPDNFTMAEPNYDMIYPILERLEEQQGLGRHWSTDYDVASGFASQGAWNNKGDEEGDGGHFGIVFRGDWGGEGEDSADSHAGYDGVTRPSRLEGEEEVTLHPGSEVNLLGMEVFKPGGFRYEIPVPDVPVYAMKRNSGTRDDPGAVYRGLSSDFLTDEEFDTIVNWEKNNGWDRDPDSFQMAEPNFEMIYPILERLEEKQGLGRHWSKDYDIAMEFAGGGITDNQYSEDYDENKEHFGIVFRGDWGGEGVDYAESHQGYDGVTRPSNHPHEEEVTLHPGSEVNLLGLDIISPDFDVYSIPTPDIPIYSNKISSHKKEGNMSAINRYLRFARAKGLDPNGSEAPRLYRRASRGLSPASMVEISRWRGAQKTAHKTADKVLSNTRSYRRKMSSSSWYLDNNLSAYVSKVQQKFACSCGAKLAVPSYTNCKCGKVWNSYKIHSATKGDTMFVVREVPVRENVLVANNKTASRRPARRGYRR